METQIAKNKILTSPLKESTMLNETNSSEEASLSVPLLLTPLVDAFAILVIYLLVNTSAAQHDVIIDETLSLPMASQTQMIEGGVVVKVKKGQYYIDNKKISSRQLSYSLQKIMAKQNPDKIPYLLVEADKASSFEKLSPIMVAGSSAGFAKIKFAVVQGERK